jgi:catechol 2,3-dioxygenase-like lactoylglutathione lyase family enzyme
MGSTAVDLNHAMIYVKDVPRALAFYRDGLGMAVIEEMEGYARLRAPRGNATIGLHQLGGEVPEVPPGEALRLYFEVEELDGLCARLVARGVPFDQMPRDEEWGWRHAYLRDPDGHRLSLYWAGEKRLRPTRP